MGTPSLQYINYAIDARTQDLPYDLKVEPFRFRRLQDRICADCGELWDKLAADQQEEFIRRINALNNRIEAAGTAREVAEEPEPEISGHAAGMVHADERGVRYDVERLRSAVFGMRAPADVGKQAGGMAQARFFPRFVDAEGSERRIRPEQAPPKHY